MKKMILSLLVLSGFSVCAHASTDVNFMKSSATWSGVTVTTGTTIRVDNWNWGVVSGTSTIMPERSGLFIRNLDSADTIYCGYTSAVSSATASAYIGLPVVSNETLTVGIDGTMAYHCIAADAAGALGARIYMEQNRRR